VSDCIVSTPSPSSPGSIFPVFLKGTGSGYLQTGVVTSIALPNSAAGLSTADLDGDGRADLTVSAVVSSPSSRLGVTYLKGQADGSFRTGSETEFVGNLGLPVASSFAGAGDLNGDGKPDLLVAAWTNQDNVQDVSWLVISEKGSTNLSAGFSLGGMGSLALGSPPADFNSDGHLDVAAVLDQVSPSDTPISKGVAIIYGKGDGTFGLPVNIPGSPPSSFIILSTGDQNGDGKLDLLVELFPPIQTVVTCGDGAGNFSAFSSGPCR
jgi:hypothetical protein